jgi:hypothetical protein
VPRHTSKILATAKKPPSTSASLIGEFDKKGFTGAGDTYLRKADKKDLRSAMIAEDWETKYREAWDRYRQEREKTDELRTRMSTKQERFIAREQEYRKTIEQIEKNIENHSTRPLEVI